MTQEEYALNEVTWRLLGLQDTAKQIKEETNKKLDKILEQLDFLIKASEEYKLQRQDNRGVSEK